ncbi:Uracil phosphoribosyltransferase, synthesizes UMP from uracil, partial [Gonapodya sp. JEL0774]
KSNAHYLSNSTAAHLTALESASKAVSQLTSTFADVFLHVGNSDSAEAHRQLAEAALTMANATDSEDDDMHRQLVSPGGGPPQHPGLRHFRNAFIHSRHLVRAHTYLLPYNHPARAVRLLVAARLAAYLDGEGDLEANVKPGEALELYTRGLQMVEVAYGRESTFWLEVEARVEEERGVQEKTKETSISEASGPYVPPSNVIVLPQTRELIALMTVIRDKETKRPDFIFYADRIIRLLVEEGLNHLPFVEKTVMTATGLEYKGLGFPKGICGVSIMRAGESMEQGLRDCCKGVRIGKILIQRDEDTALPELFYSKLPEDIASRHVLLLDPMLATGGSAHKAIEVLIQRGVQEENIVFINLVGCPEGITYLLSGYPKLRIVTACVDAGLNEKKYILPGLGE